MKTLVYIVLATITLPACVFTPPSSSSSSTSGTIVSIETRMPGASPETMEAAIVKPIEKVLVTLEGVESVHSTTSESRSYIEVYFKAQDRTKPLEQVRSAVNAVQLVLPRTSTPSVVVVRETSALR